MLALCLMLLVTYYAFNYVDIIDRSLHILPYLVLLYLCLAQGFFIERVHLHIVGKYICTYVGNVCTINFENFYAHMYQNTHVFNICCD